MPYTHAYDQLAAAEAAGAFVPLNPGAADPYPIWANTILICPIVDQNGA